MADPSSVLTDRLELRASDPEADLPALGPIFADPEGWRHAPASRHTTRDRTRAWLERSATAWRTAGLSYWTIRLRDGGAVIGAGGVQRHCTGTWNLAYRLGTPYWGKGYASELGRAALAAAGEADPSVAVIAWVLAHNAPSRRVAERIGLTDRGLRVDPSDGTARVAYADRDLDDALMPLWHSVGASAKRP